VKLWVLTRPAERDLDEAHLYLCEHASIETAVRLREGIEQACDGLAEMPGKGEQRPDWTDRPVRFWLVDPYWIIYRPDTDPLEVVRVLHAARDIPRTL